MSERKKCGVAKPDSIIFQDNEHERGQALDFGLGALYLPVFLWGKYPVVGQHPNYGAWRSLEEPDEPAKCALLK